MGLFHIFHPRCGLLYVDDLLDACLVVEGDDSLGSVLHFAFLEGVESVILAEADVLSGEKLSASLSYDDGAR